jgi:hypothetical protein
MSTVTENKYTIAIIVVDASFEPGSARYETGDVEVNMKDRTNF